MVPYIFLDRDGTINKEVDYLHKIEDFVFEDGCVEGLRLLQKKGYELVIITNQSGIARGYYSLEDMNRLHVYMENMLEANGIQIRKIYSCPHGPKDACECRKPKLGLFLQAIRELHIDTKHSYAVGDRMRDLLPAKLLLMRCAGLRTGHGRQEDFAGVEVYDDLLAFAYAAEDMRGKNK